MCNDTYPGDARQEQDQASSPEKHAEIVKLFHLFLLRLVFMQHVEAWWVITEEQENDGASDYDNICNDVSKLEVADVQ